MGEVSEGETVRVFCAVEVSRKVREAAAAHAERLRREFPYARPSWARPEGLHITLKFIGDVEAPHVRALSRAAGAAAISVRPFCLTIDESGTFPPRGAPRILWLGVRDESGRLSQLRRRLERECQAAGFPREERAFKPHLTVARLRTPKDAHALSEAHRRMPFGPHRFQVSELLVIRSELSPGGSRYTTISRHPFTSLESGVKGV